MEEWFFFLKFFYLVTDKGSPYECIKIKPKPSWFSKSAGSCVGSSNTGDVNNWFYCLSPRVSHFHQPAGEYVLAASNSVQLRVCDSGICEGSYCTKFLNYKHSYEAFLLQGSSESCMPVQMQLYSYSEIFPSFCFHKKLV